MPKKPKDKLEIAMLGHKRIPSREGGVEIVVEQLSTRMTGLGHSVTCYNRKGHHVSGADFDTAITKEYKGVRLKNVWTLDKKGLAAMTSSFSAAVLAAFGKYDVVHFHAEGPCAMLWFTKLFRKKCIATIHGLDHQRAKWGKFASWYIRFGERCAAHFADEVIVLSKNVQNYFMEKYGRETVFIPNGVTAPNTENAEIITDLYSLNRDSYILYLGRLVPEKGVEYLIDAFAVTQTDKKLVIAGGSSDTAEYEKLLKLKAEKDSRIIFTGFVEGKTLDELYSNAYIYVLPSDLEGMPLSLLEAMSYGNCCLTSDIEECASVIEEYGITFRKGDINDLKSKLQMLCDNTDTVNKFKSQASEYISQKYNWDDVTSKTLALYGVPAAAMEEKQNESIAHK